ncbi:hypothetical protein ABW20_dc0101487 [Dactylellina cionopaga]|nr:hypothetical protein ABW20_dc0101487 [Dactylellina cionopaga]
MQAPLHSSHGSLPAPSNENPAPSLDPSIREVVAQELYKRYKLSRLQMAQNNETETSALKENDASFQDTWDKLPDRLKTSTRAQADDIPRKLQLLGYFIAKDSDKIADGQILETFTVEQLEFLGEVEHNRWAEERMASGWQASGQRDSTTQQTPFFVPYAELEQKWKDVDKDMVNGIPEILRNSGYKIYQVKK